MYDFIFMAHSGWRYIALLALTVAVVKYLVAWLRDGGWQKTDQRIGLIATIVIDIQLLLGLILWPIASNHHPLSRVRGMEHPALMILAIIIMHVGWARVKKAADASKARAAAITFIITGLLVAVSVALVTGVL